ncbi:cytochrome P450 [Saccharothrix australiensis]|uniref:Cytochrome P450 n=1 Tax=Saccharothrix australiensis TaxID=2072 RepID=A0A495VZC3_9PSEU|nr:cytochrome P450 [Saccharothrix australiensis]RKT54559.1 cytochrome P450 [Saccharothrix australiensis]
MTSTSDPGGRREDGVPEFPMRRAAECPFDPPPRLCELRDRAPLARVRIWDGSTPWLVTRYADQRAVLGDRRVSADIDRPEYPRVAPGNGLMSFIGMDDPEHARLRRMVGPAFTVRNVAALRPVVQRVVDDALDAMVAGPNPADLVEAFALPVPSLVICTMLDVPYADHDFFQATSRTVFDRRASAEQRTRASRRLERYLAGMVESKVGGTGGDLLSRVGARVAAGELDLRQAAEMAVLLLVAGHETTANMIALGTLLLLRHPDQLALLRDSADPGVATRAVEETLRYLNVTHTGRRRVATEDMLVGGLPVRAGEALVLPGELANRDPLAFPDPDRLDITRHGRHHLAFGFGVHQCLGQPLARLELEVVYRTLYRRLPGLRLAVDFADLVFKHDAFVYGVEALPVAW